MTVAADKTRTIITVTKELLERLDEAANRLTKNGITKVSRNDIMVAAFEEYLKKKKK